MLDAKQPEQQLDGKDGQIGLSYDSSASVRDIIRNVLHTKKGSSYDRAFPDCIPTSAFSWNNQRPARITKKEDTFDEERKRAFEDDTSRTISDHQVSSAERFKRITNEMLMRARDRSEHPLHTKNNNQRMREWHSYSKPIYNKAYDYSGWKDRLQEYLFRK